MSHIKVRYYIRASRLILTTAALFLLTMNSYSTAPKPDITLYGNEKCGYCSEIMKRLDDEGIQYIYLNVELYGQYQEEMFDKLKKSGFTTTAIFPVLDVKGQILMKPEFDDIKKALAGEKISSGKEKKIRTPKWRPEKKRSLNTDFGSVKIELKQSDIIFYDDGSGSGKTLLKQLKKEQIPFTLKQLNKLSNAAYFEMSSRLAALGYGNVTLFPVIEVRGEMIMNPSLEDVRILIIEMTGK